MDVTVVILTMNEELNIKDCIESVNGFAKRIVVVDSGSKDKTVEIAKSLGAEVYYHEFENYSKQINWALDNANVTTKWSFRLDADERLTMELCKELETIAIEHNDDDVNGVVMEAWLYFMGKKIKHGCRNKRKIMMFKTGIGRIEDRRMDEHTILSEGKTVCARNKFIHYDFKDMTHWINKMNWYATREMQDYFEYKEGKTPDCLENDAVTSKIRKKKFGFYYKFPLFFRCWLLFIYNYIFKFGFLDGKEGFVYNYMYHRWYRTLVDSKILEQKKYNRPFEKTGALK